MAVVMRPYHETVPMDLQQQYDSIDRQVVGDFQAVAVKLRQLSQKRISAIRVHPDFDANRYSALKRTAMQLASDLERAIANSGLAK